MDRKDRLPIIACLTPTFRRPALLANMLACFLNQDYPKHLRKLFIWDTGNQFADINYFHYSLWHDEYPRSPTPDLPQRYNALIKWARNELNPDIYAVFEDDDVFLPWHLQTIAEAWQNGVEFHRPRYVYSNYSCPKDGTVIIEGAAGRFHSSWAFTDKIIREIGGYPDTGRLDFDQQLHGLLSVKDPNPGWLRNPIPPSYTYRFGNPGTYHGSSSGESNFQAHWEAIGKVPGPWIGELEPKFDAETEAILKKVFKGYLMDRAPV